MGKEGAEEGFMFHFGRAVPVRRNLPAARNASQRWLHRRGWASRQSIPPKKKLHAYYGSRLPTEYTGFLIPELGRL